MANYIENHGAGISGGGVSFCSLLAILFIALKLLDKIAWSWIWVLSPIWIPFAFFILLLIIVALIFGVKNLTRFF